MNCSRYHFGLLSILLLVALRVAIGWHFFNEGMAHYHESGWSSEGFLRGAKGPFAEHYHRALDDFYGWDRTVAAPEQDPALADPKLEAEQLESDKGAGSKEKESPFDAWLSQVTKTWRAERDRIVNHYGFDDEQKKKADNLVTSFTERLKQQLAEFQSELVNYRHELYRLDQMKDSPGADDIPNVEKRIATREKTPWTERGVQLEGSPASWKSELKATIDAFRGQLLDLRTESQAIQAPLPEEKSQLAKIDRVVTYGLIGVGACLIVGLFTRLAAVMGGVFLLQIIGAQPPWIEGVVPTYNQIVEMIALFALASTPVGRWGGLDFFLHAIFVRPFVGRP